MKYKSLKDTDDEIFRLLKEEEKRQNSDIPLIPSENFASDAVLKAIGSVFTNKYAEGYSGKRYYKGAVNIDKVESLAIERAKQVFGAYSANVQPYSGSPANAAVYFALAKPFADTILGLELSSGGHLTHGSKVSFSGKLFNSVMFTVKKNGEIDYDEVESLALKHKPKIIWAGTTAYTKLIDYERFRKIADKVGEDTYLVADISHISGLVASNVIPSPVNFVDIITTTTHKDMRGPRGAMIMVTPRGIQKNPSLDKMIDDTVFPFLQGGPHINTIAGIAVALKESESLEFKEYSKQILLNCKALCTSLINRGFELVGGVSETHLTLINLTKDNINGWEFAYALEKAGIIVNASTIPHDENSPFFPSGIRIGTPAATTLCLKEKDMDTIAEFIYQVKLELDTFKFKELSSQKLRKDPNIRKGFINELINSKRIKEIKLETENFMKVYSK